jgi:hypothetical protein
MKRLRPSSRSRIVPVVAAAAVSASLASIDAQRSPVPRMWDEDAMAHLEVPLSHAAFSPTHVSADYYYQIPVRPIFRSYPVYVPDREPSGYFVSLQEKEAEQIGIEAAEARNDGDWIMFGEITFQAPTSYDCCVVRLEDVRSSEWYERTGAPVAADGTLPYLTYVIRERGKVELGTFSCGFCHTRIMADGSVIRGAQGNLPFDRIWAYWMRKRETAATMLSAHVSLFGNPWETDPAAPYRSLELKDYAEIHEAIPPGVLARHRSSVFDPVQVPDLIGVQNRRYLDRSGLQTHQSIVDLMRYGALNQGGDDLASFGGFVPAGSDNKELPPPHSQTRYSDDHLYALARYLYSLTPPVNPTKPSSLTEQGKGIFEREGCAACHIPPLYTNNQLLAVRGFEIPSRHRTSYNIAVAAIDTDPVLTLETRRGTGYYKVPSLLGVWYRGPFQHGGRVQTLEDWFDPARLKDDYRPTGFPGRDDKSVAVPGHEFGLRLTGPEKQALVAFLKTL